MLNLVIGYKSRGKDASAEVLYLGRDGNAARDALNNPPEGVLRTMLSYPQPYKNRFFNSPEEVERAEKAKAAAEAAAKKAEAEAKKAEAEAKAKAEAAAKKDEAENDAKAEKSPTEKQAKKSSH